MFLKNIFNVDATKVNLDNIHCMFGTKTRKSLFRHVHFEISRQVCLKR